METESASNFPGGSVLFDVLLLLIGSRKRMRVSGDSMYPTICDGDTLFIDPRAYSSNVPRVDEIVVARHPYVKDMLMVKRIRAVHHDGTAIDLAGDNPDESTDSRGFGNLNVESLVGRVNSVWKKK